MVKAGPQQPGGGAGAAQRHATLISAHRERLQGLSDERKQLLRRQADLLAGVAATGSALPFSPTPAAGGLTGGGGTKAVAAAVVADDERKAAEEGRQASLNSLVARLSGEEAAARAALDALKQGVGLSRAREIAARVLQSQQQNKAAGNSDLAAAGGGDTATLLRPRGRSVAFALGTEDTSNADADTGTYGSRATAPAAQDQPTRSPAAPPQRRPASASRSVAGQPQSQLTAANPDEEAADELGTLRRQVEALRMAVEGAAVGDAATAPQPPPQLMPTDYWPTPAPGQPPFAPAWWPGHPAAAVYPYALPPPYYAPHTPPQLQQPGPVLAPWAAAAFAAPATATAAAQPAQHRVPTTGTASEDPDVSAARAKHARDMAFMGMAADRARAEADLERARAALAELRRGLPAAGPAGPTDVFVDAAAGAMQEEGGGAMAAAKAGRAGRRATLDSGQQQLGLAAASPLPWDVQPPEAGVEEIVLGFEEEGEGGDADAPAWAQLGGDPDSAAAAGGDGGVGPPADASIGGAAVDSASVAAAAAAAVPGPVMAARAVDSDVLRVMVRSAGPFLKRGTYRVAVSLYEGFQPVTSSPDVIVRSATGRRTIGGTTAPSPSDPTAAPQPSAAVATAPGGALLKFGDALTLGGLRLSAASLIVFELLMAKPGVAGLPTREALVAWGFAPALPRGRAPPAGAQSVPLFRLPLLPAARRKFSYGGAQLDFRVARFSGSPGDLDSGLEGGSAIAGAARRMTGGSDAAAAADEDIPGVPSAAWVRVQRGTPPADPFTPGDGFAILIDGARFLPPCTTITRAVASVWSSSGAQLSRSIEGVALPAGRDALNPSFAVQGVVGLGPERFEDPTATIMIQVHTIDKFLGERAVVGFALLPAFLDPREGRQPISRSVRDYVLNQGAFQIPLHAGAPDPSAPLRASSLDGVPRVACASLLVRVMTPENAKLQRRQQPPSYSDHVYDTTRSAPTAVERRLFGRLLAAGGPPVREAARMAMHLLRRRARIGGRGSAAVAGPPQWGGTGGPGTAAGRSTQDTSGSSGSGGGGSLLGWMLGPSTPAGGEGGDAAAASALAAAGADPCPSAAEVEAAIEASKEVMDWMSDVLAGGTAPPPFIGFNTARPYQPDLGFMVAVDGAHRVARPLPIAALVSCAPPAGFYQDHPIIDGVRLTLDYDLSSPLAAPRWTDGYHIFFGAPYTPGLCIVVDARHVVPAAGGASAPAGWALLPVFERAGPYVASGAYQLPLFQGVPGSTLLADIVASPDPHAALASHIAAGRVRPSLDAASVCVRLLCATRAGQLEAPAWAAPLAALRLPRYAAGALTARHVAEMRRVPRGGKTYRQAKPEGMSDEQWVDAINDAAVRAAGLDDGGEEEEGDGGGAKEVEGAAVGGGR